MKRYGRYLLPFRIKQMEASWKPAAPCNRTTASLDFSQRIRLAQCRCLATGAAAECVAGLKNKVQGGKVRL